MMNQNEKRFVGSGQSADGVKKMWMLLKAYKYWLFVPPVLLATIALIAAKFFVPRLWEASAIVQVGQVAQVGQQVAQQLDPVASMVLRMNHPSFASQISARADTMTGEDTAIQPSQMPTLKVEEPRGLEKSAGLMEIKIRANSKELALRYMHNTVETLQELHVEQYKAAVKRLEKQRQGLMESAIEHSAEIDILKNQLKKRGNREASDAGITVVLQSERSAQDNVESKLVSLGEQLSSERTFPTRLIGAISVPNTPVFPNVQLLVSLAFWLGLLMSVCAVFLHVRLNLSE